MSFLKRMFGKKKASYKYQESRSSSSTSVQTGCDHCGRKLFSIPGLPSYRCRSCQSYICNPCALSAWQKLNMPIRQNLPTCPKCGIDVRDGRIFG